MAKREAIGGSASASASASALRLKTASRPVASDLICLKRWDGHASKRTEEDYLVIDAIVIQNFKSIALLRLPLKRFTCLIGMNGAGKSTLLQAVDFIAQLMSGRIDDWLAMRDWKAIDLVSKLRPESNIDVNVTFNPSSGPQLTWSAKFNRRTMTCSVEVINQLGTWKEVFSVRNRTYRVSGVSESTGIAFNYQGSLLSQLVDTALTPELIEFRDALRNIRSLELLAPNLMRKRSRPRSKDIDGVGASSNETDIGAGGERLSSFLHSVKGESRERLLAMLKDFYPSLSDFKLTNQRAGWKRLSVAEQFGDRFIETEARHLNDGLLRVLAILAQIASDRSLTLLDEIENGINPEIAEKLVDALVHAPQQVLVTTHSPMILNYLDDETARNSVQFVYKSPEGETRVRPFFELPRTRSKLELMGPGEAFIDTDLLALTRECVELDREEADSKAGAESAK